MATNRVLYFSFVLTFIIIENYDTANTLNITLI